MQDGSGTETRDLVSHVRTRIPLLVLQSTARVLPDKTAGRAVRNTAAWRYQETGLPVPGMSVSTRDEEKAGTRKVAGRMVDIM
jgi:hypothetical protein